MLRAVLQRATGIAFAAAPHPLLKGAVFALGVAGHLALGKGEQLPPAPAEQVVNGEVVEPKK